MKEKIILINRSIEEKRDRLKEKAERYFASIVIPSDAISSQHHKSVRSQNPPPISYILYGVAGLSVIAAIVSGFIIPFLAISIVSALGGNRLYKLNQTKSTKSSFTNSNINSLKNEFSSKVLDSVKSVTEEWESFMELKQNEIQSIIISSILNENEREILLSKIYVYEVIDISIADFTLKVNSVVNVSDFKEQINSYKSKLLSAIDVAAFKQVSKYASLTDV